VKLIEPEYRELESWPIAPIVCDNNLLAASEAHFNKVVDSLKGLKGTDFNQGLDARLMTAHHAERLAELHCKCRVAWDGIGEEKAVFRALKLLDGVGIPKRNIGCYVLVGHNDTPDDALYRLEALRTWGVRPNPMRYQPLDTLKKDSYVAPGWTDKELRRMMRYYSRLKWLEHIPFAEYAG